MLVCAQHFREATSGQHVVPPRDFRSELGRRPVRLPKATSGACALGCLKSRPATSASGAAAPGGCGRCCCGLWPGTAGWWPPPPPPGSRQVSAGTGHGWRLSWPRPACGKGRSGVPGSDHSRSHRPGPALLQPSRGRARSWGGGRSPGCARPPRTAPHRTALRAVPNPPSLPTPEADSGRKGALGPASGAPSPRA